MANYFIGSCAWWLAPAAGLAAAAILGISLVAIVLHRRLAQQSAQTIAALNYMPMGFCMFDAGKRLVLCNDAYGEMYGLPGELRTPGTPHDEIIGHRVTSGLMGAEKSNSAVKQK